MRIVSGIGKTLGKGAKAVLSSKPMQYGKNKFRSDKAGFIAGVTLSSILLKDAIGCVYYVKQSLGNKNIPEEKRKFVAALDMANGGLMIIAQFLAFFTLSNKKVQTKMFDKVFGKMFSPESINKIAERTKKTLSKSGAKFDAAEFAKTMASKKEKSIGAFGAVASLVGATVIAKRMIVPFIATPLAQWMKDNIINKGEAKGGSKDAALEREIVNSSLSGMTSFKSMVAAKNVA